MIWHLLDVVIEELALKELYEYRSMKMEILNKITVISHLKSIPK